MTKHKKRAFYRSEIVAKSNRKFSQKKIAEEEEERPRQKDEKASWLKKYRRWIPAVTLVGVGVLGILSLFLGFRMVSKRSLMSGPPIRSFIGPRFLEIPLSKSGEKLNVPVVTAKSFIAQDPTSGVVLASKSAGLRLLPASTTKIVTALVALDIYKLNEVVTIGEVVSTGQQVGLVTGEKISVENLLYAMLVESGNDAAFALADFDPLGRNHFVQLMNQKVERLGLKNTHFANPAGLDDSDQYSTAEDLAKLGVVAMTDPSFARIVGTQQSVIFSADQVIEHRLTNINQLLGKIPGIRGIKTGYTEAAGENLVTDVVRENHEIVIVVLGSKDRFGDTEKLVNWAYDNFQWIKVQASLDRGLVRKP